MVDTEETALQQVQPGQLATVSFEDDAGLGTENVGVADVQQPFLRVVQAMSAILKTEEPTYNPDARQGMLLNTATGALYNELLVIPIYYQKCYTEYEMEPKKDGSFQRGDFVSVHSPLSDYVKMAYQGEGRALHPQGKPNNQLFETHNHYLLTIDPETQRIERVLFSMQMTFLKHSRRFNTAIQSIRFKSKDGREFNPASFANVYRMRTTVEKNDSNSWYAPVITRERAIDPTDAYDAELYQFCKGLYLELKQRDAESLLHTVDVAEDAGNTPAQTPYSGGTRSQVSEEDIAAADEVM